MNEKADSTLRSSQAVPHPSTSRALCCLTSEVERDPVHSTRYGRRRQEWRQLAQNAKQHSGHKAERSQSYKCYLRLEGPRKFIDFSRATDELRENDEGRNRRAAV